MILMRELSAIFAGYQSVLNLTDREIEIERRIANRASIHFGNDRRAFEVIYVPQFDRKLLVVPGKTHIPSTPNRKETT